MSTYCPDSHSKSHHADHAYACRSTRRSFGTLTTGTPLLLTVAIYLSLAACSETPTSSAKPTGLHVQDAYIKRAVPGRKMTAAYATLINYSSDTLCFVGYEADFATTVELHVTESVGGPDSQRVAMRRVPEQCISAGERVTLEPGGKHLMIMGLDANALPQATNPDNAKHPTTQLRLGTRNGRLFEAEFAVVPFNYSAQNLR